MIDYDCNVCNDFAANGTPELGPTEAEPWHPDCWLHQDRWNKPRCEIRGYTVSKVEFGPIKRCNFERGHRGPCRFVLSWPS